MGDWNSGLSEPRITRISQITRRRGLAPEGRKVCRKVGNKRGLAPEGRNVNIYTVFSITLSTDNGYDGKKAAT